MDKAATSSPNSKPRPSCHAAISDDSIDRAHIREAALYAERRPNAKAAANHTAGTGFLSGVPLHWMCDWPLPFPMIIDQAHGSHLVDIDGNSVVDFCLGDTGAMFGHSPEPIMRALRERDTGGLTYMLPSRDASVVGTLLYRNFGLPCWQIAVTASDANRFALRAARAATGRRKIIVFDGCYHGTAEDALVDLVDGKTVPRRSLVGQVYDATLTTMAIPFNNVNALAAALSGGDIACVMAEPVMTNCGMILPQPQFMDQLRELTREAGTLLLIDETHTISTGPGGYTAVHGLEPDLLVIGKPIAGGIPAAVWGMSGPVADKLLSSRSDDEYGHSGIGTTLAGSALQLACLRVSLEHLMTAATYAKMISRAEALQAGIESVVATRGLPWHVVRVGARLEIVFRNEPLKAAEDARRAANGPLERLLHLALLNRGFLLTPFHNMMLVGPDTTADEISTFLDAFSEIIDALLKNSDASE